MISPDKIDEWIREVEERPASAALIIRYIANRLSELTSREEELAAENIELLNGRKVAEYESRIASLEYQLELLKRQLGGDIFLPGEATVAPPIHEATSLLVYNALGEVISLEIEPEAGSTGQTVGKLAEDDSRKDVPVALLATTSNEELLFIFDSGRTAAHPAEQLTKAGGEALAWSEAFLEEPRIKEELAAIQPIATMPLFELCIQASRKGYLKKTKMQSFTSHLKDNYIGTGVKLPADKTFGLTFANPGSLFVMVSREGFIFSMPVEGLPASIDEVIRLATSDHIVSTFIVDKEPVVLFITENGKAVNRDVGWLETANSFKSHGQQLLSRERREAGTRIVAASPVDDTSWGAFLLSDGSLVIHMLQDLIAKGSLGNDQAGSRVVGFSAFHPPVTDERKG